MPTLGYHGPPDFAQAIHVHAPSIQFDDLGHDGFLLVLPFAQISADRLQEIVRTVRDAESKRLYDRDPGGWPVWCVLIHEGQLQQTDDTVRAWDEILRSQLTAFGRVDLKLLTVDQDSTPLVTDIQSRCARHGRTRRVARWRVGKSVILAPVVLVVITLAIAATIAFAGPMTDDRLTTLVRRYQLNEKPTAVRLSDARRPRVKAALQALREDVAWSILDPELKSFVEERFQELQRYDQYASRFRPPQMSAGDCRSVEELDKLAEALRTTLAPPSDDAEAWAETEAVRLRRKWAIEIDTLRDAEDKVVSQLSDHIRTLHDLTLSSKLDSNWRNASRQTLDEIRIPIFNTDQPLPGSFELPVPGGEKLTCATVFEFDRVIALQRDLDDARDRLARLLTLAAAWGFSSDRDDAVLEWAGLANARERWTELAKRYPELIEQPKLFSLNQWGDPNRDQIRFRLDRHRDRLVSEIKEQIRLDVLTAGGGRETIEGWRTWSVSAGERLAPAANWLSLYDTLHSDSADEKNPIQEMITLVTTPSRTIHVERFIVRWPESLGETVKEFQLKVEDRSVTWKAIPDLTQDRGVVTAKFEPTAAITFPAGQALSAKLILGSGATVVTWDRPTSNVFPDDLFLNEPTLLRPGAKPERAVGVTVQIMPTGRWPVLPRLMPDFRVSR